MSEIVSKHTVSVLVDNEPGVLARVIGLISGRGYNIDSLTVAEVDAEKHISRITIVAPGTEETVNKMISQLQRIVPVKRAANVTFEKQGIETRSKELQVFAGGAKKGDWDVGIAVDAIRLSTKLDTIIIVSGDGDFVPLVEFLKNHAGCQVEVMSFGKSSSQKLVESCDEFFDLDKNPRKYLLGGRGRK